jgi:hypothetical protein
MCILEICRNIILLRAARFRGCEPKAGALKGAKGLEMPAAGVPAIREYHNVFELRRAA